MASDHPVPPWAIRSTLVSVADLDRSIAFYQELGPFAVIVREDAVAVLGDVAPTSIVLMLRKAGSGHQARHGPQSLGIRAITFNVGSLGELDRVESFLKGRDLFTTRRTIEGASEVVLGRDPDNSPLVFICYLGQTPGADYYRSVAEFVYSLDP